MPLNYLSLVAMLLLLGLATVCVAVALMALTLLRPPRMTDGRAAWLLRRLSPGDLNLAYERVPFVVHDELRRGDRLTLSAWWIPAQASSARTVVLLHDYGDAKVGVIAWAPLWHELAFNILAIDLRAHGESGGRYSTAGFHERHDLAQVINELRAQRPAETKEVVLFGVGMGAAVAVATALVVGELAGVVLDSPFADFSQFAKVYMDRIGFPGPRFQRLAIWVAAHIAQADWREVRPVELIPKVACPLAIILPGDDEMISPEDTQRLKTAFHSRGSARNDLLWLASRTNRQMALTQDPQEYHRLLKQFLTRNDA